MFSEHGLVVMSSFLDYTDVISLGRVNREWRDILKKWSNSIWQQQCYNSKYINDRTNATPMIPWRELYHRIYHMNSYQWSSMTPLCLLKLSPLLVEEKGFTKECIELEWEEDSFGEMVDAYVSRCSLSNEVRMLFMVYNDGINLEAEICIDSYNILKFDKLIASMIQLSFVIDNGSSIQYDPFTYEFRKADHVYYPNVFDLVSFLIHNEVITEITNINFKIKPLKCVLRYTH